MDGDLLRIAAEVLDIIANPLNSEPLVSQPGVLGTLGLKSIGLCESKDWTWLH